MTPTNRNGGRMPDGRRRSREGWADAMEDGPPHAPAHTHRLPRAVRLAVVGLTGAVFLLLVALGLMAVYVYQANQYVQGRGEFRDAEAARMEEQSKERIRQAMCDLLDTLPEGGLLERPRAKYHCGPGIPLGQLSPEEQAQLSGRARPSVAPPLPVAPSQPQPAPDPLGGAVQTQPSPPSKPGDPHPPATSPPPPPVVDLGPITDAVCGALRVCL